MSDAAFLKACRLEQTPYTPVWLMRQVGRYMKEYRDLRAKVSFLELCQTPDLAAEATVTAVEKIGADAAIIFSDILLILQPMGLDLEFLESKGPVFRNRIDSPADLKRLKETKPAESLAYVYQAIRKARASLKPNIPLIGFCGAPFTLAAYAIEGGSSKSYDKTKTFFYKHPEAWHELMGLLVVGLTEYLNCQIEAGAQAVQIFDSWVGYLGPADYREYVLPHTKKLIAGIRPNTPVIHFGTGTATLLDSMKEAGGQVLGLDFRVELGPTWDRLGKTAVQGNLDPVVLLTDTKTIRKRVKEILDQAGGRPGHIFNLGHGILPQTPVENVIAMIDMVHELSQK